MLKRMSLALLAGASSLSIGLDHAAAIEAATLPEPNVIYADQSVQRPPVRTAYAERSNMGGGFIEFLFGDGPGQGERYQQQPAYQQPADQQRPSYQLQMLPPMAPQQVMRQQEEAVDPAQRPFDPKFEKQVVEYHGKEGAGTIIVDTPNKFLFLVQGDGKALRYGIGVGRPGFTWSGVKQISGRRRRKCWRGAPICRGTWKAARKTRSAPARCIWDRRSIAFTAPTSRGRSAPMSPPAASGCAMRT